MPKYSLSTSWNSSRHPNGFGIIKEIKALGFDTVELDWALTKNIVDDILSLKESGDIKISSLHNICPLPQGVAPGAATPDYYSLSSPEYAERGLAVAAAKNTIDYAKRLGARAVVLHIGKIYMQEQIRLLGSLINDKEKFIRTREEMIKRRQERCAGYIDNVIESLKELAPYAAKTGVCLGVENRYYYTEIPLITELETIFKNFDEGSLYYWHDVGHAEIFDRLGLARHRDYLEKFSNRLIGIHLHDIIGLMNDHNAPGFGNVDFSILKPYLRADVIKVLEVHGQASARQVQASVSYLNGIFGW